MTDLHAVETELLTRQQATQLLEELVHDLPIQRQVAVKFAAMAVYFRRRGKDLRADRSMEASDRMVLDVRASEVRIASLTRLLAEAGQYSAEERTRARRRVR